MRGTPGLHTGPLIFILYLNDLPSVLTKSKSFLYADDTAIVCTGQSLQDIVGTLQGELELATTWFSDNKLSLNLKKTKTMFFGTAHKLKEVTSKSILFQGSEVEIVDSYKYLGVLLDSKLNFDKHVNYLCSTVYPKLKLLGKIRENIGQSMSIYLYNCLINPLFAFNDYVYGSINNSEAKRLQVLQNNCIRTCLRCDKRTSRTELYEISKVRPLHEQRKEHTCSIVYQGLNQSSTPYINNMFTRTMEATNLVTRSSIRGDVFIPKTRLKISMGNIKSRGPKYYNEVPLDIREAKSTMSFKRKLKRMRIFEAGN